MLSSGKSSDFCIVIELASSELAGFARGIPCEHADHSQYSGELNKIYILKKSQRMGMGTGLIADVASHFLDRGIDSMLLFGSAENPSNAFYEALGAEKLFARNGEFHGGYGWRDLKKLLTFISSSFT
ncbi:MAG: GNAT family N-acetyltransferase [Chitinophagales bacterium]